MGCGSQPLPVLLMLLGCYTQGLLSDCPRLCECKWKSGKEAVSCVSANYTTIPSTLDVGTQILDLSSNNLMRLRDDDFFKAGLLNLQKIFMPRCRLKLVESNAFRHLINLVELDMSHNYLIQMPTYIFHTMPELRELRVNDNPIQRIKSNSFKSVPKLERVECSKCKISVIEERAFVGIENSLHWLKLDSNMLTSVKPSTFTSIVKLSGLEIAKNPWNCTCFLRPFREWMINQKIPYEDPPSCTTPTRLNNKLWDELSLDEFACEPRILNSDSKTHGFEGSNVTIQCAVNGNPQPNIKWLVKNREIVNRTNVSLSSGKKHYVIHVKNNASFLTIQTADIQDAGVYTCAAENKAGKVEMSITLAMTRKPPDDPSNKPLVIGAIIGIILISVATILTVCICSVRRRRQSLRWQGRRTASGRRHDDNYQKIEMSKLTTDNGGNLIPVVASVAGNVPLVGNTKKNGEYRVVPSLDTDQEVDEDEDATYDDNQETPTPTTKPSSKLWAAAASGRSISSPNSGHWNANVGDNNLDPNDLHIPRRTKEETRDVYNKSPGLIYGIYNASSSSTSDVAGAPIKHHRKLPKIPPNIQPHIMKKQFLPNNGSLYSSSSEINMDTLLNTEEENVYVNDVDERTSSIYVNEDNLYSTLPRHKMAYANSRTRQMSYDSESPLLPRSRYGSSGGESSSGSRTSSRRYSEESLKFYHRSNQHSMLNQRSNSYLNLASSRQNMYVSNRTPPDSTPLLNVGDLESTFSPSFNHTLPSRRSPFNDRAAQLELFLEGYKNVHNQLSNMKEICDKLKRQQLEKRQLRANQHMHEDPNPKSILKKPASLSNPPGCSSTSTLNPPACSSTSTLIPPAYPSTSTLNPSAYPSNSTLNLPSCSSNSTLNHPSCSSNSTLNHPSCSSNSTLNPPAYPSSSTLNPPAYPSKSTLNLPSYSSNSTLNHPSCSSNSTLYPPAYPSTSTLNPPSYPSNSTLNLPSCSSNSTLNHSSCSSNSTLNHRSCSSNSTLNPPASPSNSTLNPPSYSSNSTLNPPASTSNSTLNPAACSLNSRQEPSSSGHRSLHDKKKRFY